MISLPLIPVVTDLKNNKAIFQIDSLYPGYGATIGNSLRRVLLSSLEGAAITKIKIKNVQHEFATISGVLEDVLTIILNLKQVRFKVFSDDPQKAILKVKGEKEIKASDFKLPTQIEISDKSIHIATLTSKSVELEIEVEIEKGIGYSPKELRKKEKLAIGEIAIDAIFTPVKTVSFRVENMRVGERTDFDKLFLEIETDGTLTPQEAFYTASSILLKHFELIAEGIKGESKTQKAKILEVEDKKQEVSGIGVEDLKFSTRTLNALLKNNLKTTDKIIKKSEENILKMEGMGEKAVKEIKRKLKKLGLELK